MPCKAACLFGELYTSGAGYPNSMPKKETVRTIANVHRNVPAQSPNSPSPYPFTKERKQQLPQRPGWMRRPETDTPERSPGALSIEARR